MDIFNTRLFMTMMLILKLYPYILSFQHAVCAVIFIKSILINLKLKVQKYVYSCYVKEN